VSRDLAGEGDAPRTLGTTGPRVVSQLRQRDAKLCRPAGTVTASRDVPDGDPENVVVFVVAEVRILQRGFTAKANAVRRSA
jgi:hypothetical protein